MNKRTALHILMLAVTAALGGVVDHLTQSHYVWAPVAVALLTDLRPLIASIGSAPPTAAIILAVAVATGGSSGCWLTKPPPISPTAPDGGFADASAGQTFVDCSQTALHDAYLGILPDIETALATGNYVGGLAALVTQYGLAEVECGVAWVVDKANGMAQTTADPVQLTEANNGRAWLAAHPVTFKGGAQ